MQLQRRKKQYWVTFHLLQSTVRGRRRYNIKSKLGYQAGNQNSTTNALSTLLCDWQSAACYLQAWVPDFSASIISLFAHDEPFGIHHEKGWVLSVWKKKRKKHTPASHLLCGYLQMSDGEAHHGQAETCWAEQLWKDFTSWSSSSQQRFSDVGEK